MNAKIRVKDPDAVEMIVTLTMPLWQWKSLLQDVGSSTGSSVRFRSVILDVVAKAQASFEAETDVIE